MIELKGKNGTAKVFTSNIDDVTIGQIIGMMNERITENNTVRIMPDTHYGKGSTIGTTIKLNDEQNNWRVSPNVVGVDVGCGIMMFKLSDKDIDFEKLDKVINRVIPSGQSVHQKSINGKDTQCSILDNLKLELSSSSQDRILKSLGTLGSGNHYIEVAQDDEGFYWLSVHSGSRNLGVQVAKSYQEKANIHTKFMSEYMLQIFILGLKEQGKEKEIQEKVEKYKKEMTVTNPTLSFLNPIDLSDYLHDMVLTQQYAVRNRETMMGLICQGMGFNVIDSFDSIHNYIDLDNGIIRKGATSAQKGERLVIPLNMRDGSLICEGKGNEDWNYSAPHGAGRVKSRSQAKKDIKMETYSEQMKDVYTTSVTQSTLDEAPDAYKPANEIIENIKDTVEIIHILKPVYNFKAK